MFLRAAYRVEFESSEYVREYIVAILEYLLRYLGCVLISYVIFRAY